MKRGLMGLLVLVSTALAAQKQEVARLNNLAGDGEEDSSYAVAVAVPWNNPSSSRPGNFTYAENRTHFTVWAMATASLAENDAVKKTPPAMLLKDNRGLIFINEDSLGRQGIRYSDRDSLQTWLKPLKNGEWAVCFVNCSSSMKDVNFFWKNTIIAYPDAKIELNVAKNNYRLTDVWGNRDMGNTSKKLAATIASHDVLLLRLTKEEGKGKIRREK